MVEWIVLWSAVWCSGMIWAIHETKVYVRERREAVESCGLKIEKGPSAWSMSFPVQATDGLVRVRMENTRRKQAGGVRVTLEFPGSPGFDEVRIRRENEVLKKAREIELGAPAFDDAFFLRGPVRLVSALLDADTRRLLTEVHSKCRSVDILHGEIRCEMPPYYVSAFLPLLLDLAHRFAQPPDLRQRLAENAKRDPEAGVRLHNLLLLVRELPDAPDSIEALRFACSDASPQVRLGAAMELGAEGRDVLLELAESQVDDGVSAQAVTSLGRELSFEHAQPLLLQALRRRRLQTARACVDVIGLTGTPEAVEVLAAVLEREKAELAAAAAIALGTIGNPAAEPALIQALQRGEDAVQLAATRALGRAGTVNAVLTLKEVQETSRSKDLSSAARQAIAEIQSRLPGASAGQLSLAQSEAGQLSLATDPAGQLSLPAAEPGRLSLPEKERPARFG